MAIFGLIIFLVVLLMVGIAGGLLYLFYIPIKKRLLKNGRLTIRRSEQINNAYIAILVLFSAYLTFDAFFPSKSFYEQEFKTVTLREIPQSATFMEKTASFPDFHGDYCSSAQIKLSKADYEKLLSELNSDKRLIKGEQLTFSEEFRQSLGDKNEDKIVDTFVRKIKGQEDHYLFIGFYDDRETVFVNICVS